MNILLVDDEAELATPLARILEREGYAVDVAGDGATGWTLASEREYDLLILDWMMPHLSGVELCQRLRARGNRTPVLFLTAKDTLDDRVSGLDAGADDYLVKPFELPELLARVRAQLRRSGPPAPRLSAAGLDLDCDSQLAYRNGRAIALSEKETQLLALFLRNPERTLSRQEIYEHLWSADEQPSSNVLAALIRLLRRKLTATNEPTPIHTVYGKGYRLG